MTRRKGPLPKPINERFWAKVKKCGPDDCWPWLASRNKDGYGRIGIGGHYGTMLLAHRVSWELNIGAIPDGLHVLHRCDNPKCVNPKHLFLGSQTDNMADKAEKGRAGGERHPSAKLSLAEVDNIRRASGLHREIASQFGISRQSVSNIKSGKSWIEMALKAGAKSP